MRRQRRTPSVPRQRPVRLGLAVPACSPLHTLPSRGFETSGTPALGLDTDTVESALLRPY
eukprot:1673570-Pyramimonas_sp.AAC.2